MNLPEEEYYRDPDLIRREAEAIAIMVQGPVRLMEVCGGHTLAIHRFGLKDLLPGRIELLSGPGCPVCVTDQSYLEACIRLSRQSGVLLATYGDLIRVPAYHSSLEQERSKGADIRIIYSASEALRLASENPGREVVFLGIGFETTAPATAWILQEAKKQGLTNFTVFSAHKLMPPALKALADERLRIDGFIAPGHVTAITGTSIYRFLAEDYRKGVVVAGFEPLDLMQAIRMLVRQFNDQTPEVINQYARVVKPEGNRKALRLMEEVFEPADAVWRGLGIIPLSGLQPGERYRDFDARFRFGISQTDPIDHPGCICGEILKGQAVPKECPLFGSGCTPEHPIGACMVSGEGSCAIVFRHSR